MKTKIDISTLHQFRFKNNWKVKEFRLLVEAFRRKNFLNADEKFMGLGAPSLYKSNFFTSSFSNETPRVSNWYKLTNEGKEAITLMEKYFYIPKNPIEKDETNSYLFTF